MFATNQGALILRILKGRFTPIPTTYSVDLAELIN